VAKSEEFLKVLNSSMSRLMNCHADEIIPKEQLERITEGRARTKPLRSTSLEVIEQNKPRVRNLRHMEEVRRARLEDPSNDRERSNSRVNPRRGSKADPSDHE